MLSSEPCDLPSVVVPDHDRVVRARVAAGDRDGALRTLIAALGGELHGFVLALLRDEDAAADVFATVCEDLWKGLATFRFDASLRTWGYVVARNACRRHLARSPRRREHPLSDARTSQLVWRPPTSTSTEARHARLARLRSELSMEDQALLVLRIDRGLSWEDVARVIDLDENAKGAPVEKSAAALRKRFERIKERLRQKLLEEDARA